MKRTGDMRDIVLRGAEHHLRLITAGHPAQVAKELVTVHDRHVPVQQHGIRQFALAGVKRLLAVLRLDDIEMPDMNGFEFAETVRSDRRLSATPIIALSSMISPAAIERGRQAGFHDYVAKFDRPGLIAALKEQTAETSRVAA